MAKPFLVICRKFFHVFIVGCYIPVGSLSQSLFASLIPLWGFRCWCAVRTLQEMVGGAHPTNVQSQAKGAILSSHYIVECYHGGDFLGNRRNIIIGFLCDAACIRRLDAKYALTRGTERS